MKLATFVTNTDFSDFAKARPLDDEKFAQLIAEVRPDWEVTAYWVCKDEFPTDIAGYDGVMITGSPSSVNEGTPWMIRLEDMVRDIIAQNIPLFGACFGHQIIAKALGAEIRRNAAWGHGLIDIKRTGRTEWSGPSEAIPLYGSHIEQVASLPPGAQRLFESTGCPIAGFGIGKTVFTIQHHPEMTETFIADLVEEFADYVGESATEIAQQSLKNGVANRAEFAEEIASFFESAGA